MFRRIQSLLLVAVCGMIYCGNTPPQRPNIVLIITDDQGYGDLGHHGNQLIATPNLDRLARQSMEISHFYVSPVCAPTRASLMTGRYNYRTGVVDTYLGRAMMHTQEVTLAELLGEAGYSTAIFGKWHLGDNYPMRPMDQGFQESLVHRGGGIGQPSDPPGNSYFDPVLLRNGTETRSTGYCTDIFFDTAAAYIEQHQSEPFFVYISTNAPHTPLQIAEEYVNPYLADGIDETTAKVYGMVTNIDDNVGRLLSRLEELHLADNTILIFMTDNGHQQERYSAGLRGRKASVFEGGIRVPFFVRWPARIEAGTGSGVAAHIDILPTLLEACSVAPPADLLIDGVSLLPLWVGESDKWPERLLYFQAHRGDVPQRGRACAVRGQRYKLVQPLGWSPGPIADEPKWLLFDMVQDPGEKEDLASDMPEQVERLQQAYYQWYEEVSATRGYEPPRIALGASEENPVTLTRQDWRGPLASWAADGLGHWEVRVENSAEYIVRLRFPQVESGGVATFKLSQVVQKQAFPEGASTVEFEPVRLEKGEFTLEATLEFDERTTGAHYVDVERLDNSPAQTAALLLRD